MKLSTLTPEQIVVLKNKLVELFAQDLSFSEVMSRAGITRTNLNTLLYDQMFGNRVVKARGNRHNFKYKQYNFNKRRRVSR